MKKRFGRAGARGVCMAILVLVAGLLALPAMAQTVMPGPVEGTAPVGHTGAVRALAGGGYHACALRFDRSVTCWGANDQGQALPPPEQFVAVAAGQSNSCGVTQDGGLVCWGANYQGQSAPPPGTFTAVVLGMAHGCALQTNGEAVCWGGGYNNEATPPPGPFVRLSAGFHHSCGLRPDGQVECWGDLATLAPSGRFVSISSGAWHACGVREDGQASCWGDGSPEKLTPPATETFTTITAGYDHTCGLTIDGRLRCWGDNYFNQTLAPAGRFVAVEAGAFFTCAVQRDGRTVCWGSNHYGETQPPLDVADGSMPIRADGVAPTALGNVLLLTSGLEHTCALLRDGRAVCWGRDQGMAPPPMMRFSALVAGAFHTCGVLRDGGVTTCWGDVAEPPPPEQFTALAAGDHFSCGLREDGQATCWDGPYQGRQVAYGPYVSISAGGAHACGVRSDGQSECWTPWEMQPTVVSSGVGFVTLSVDQSQACGIQPDGLLQCGGPTNPPWMSPAYEPMMVAMVSVGPSRACALTTSGRLSCWGGGWYGGALPGEPVNETFAAISMGGVHGCALRPDGTVTCWGDNYVGQATPPLELTIAESIDAGVRHTCAVRQGGMVACWGDNSFGQATVPPGLFVSVGNGEDFSCGLRQDGSVECWGGDNSFGQRSPPPELFGQISIGRRGGCGLTRDGLVRCWGVNGDGPRPPDWALFKSVSAGAEHNCGVRVDGFGECWGDNNNYGQMDVPPPEPGVSWLSLQAGDYHSCGLRSDGQVRCWGGDFAGQVGATPTGNFRALSVGALHSCAISTGGRLQCWGNYGTGMAILSEGAFIAVSAGAGYSCAINVEGAYECWGNDDLGQAPPRSLVLAAPVMGLNQPADSRVFMVAGPSDGGGWNDPEVPGLFRITAGALPPGMTFADDGRIGGMPTAAGNYAVAIAGVDSQGFGATRTFHLLVDGTPPVVEPYYSWPDPMFNGWHTGNITISWSPYDPETWAMVRSGCVATTVTDTPGTTVECTAESPGGVTSQSVTIKRDATPPETSFSATPPAVTNGTDAQFAFTGSDATAGVAYYECSLDGAAAFATCTSPHSVQVGASGGSHTFQVRAVDQAGHRDPTPASHTWRVDTTPPLVTPSISGTLGSDGWYVGDVQVSWAASDAESAITATSGCNTVTLTSDTIGAGFTCTVTSAGGTTVKTVTVKRDTVAPSVTWTTSPAPTSGNWFNGQVALSFSCSDATSGVGSCPAAQAFFLEGQWTSEARTFVDMAGNIGNTGTVPVWIDLTAPILAPTVGSGVALLNAAATASANARDTLSGLASQGCATPATASIGNKSVACTASDVAGNQAAETGSYRVVYPWQGFTGVVANPPLLNTFKAGRSAPLRWRLLDAQGVPVTNLANATVSSVAITCPNSVTQRIWSYGGSDPQLRNLGDGNYALDWPTSGAYRGTCRRVDLSLGDGEVHSALFLFN